MLHKALSTIPGKKIPSRSYSGDGYSRSSSRQNRKSTVCACAPHRRTLPVSPSRSAHSLGYPPCSDCCAAHGDGLRFITWLPAYNQIAAPDIIADVGVIVCQRIVLDAPPAAQLDGCRVVPFPTAEQIDPVPAARIWQGAAVRLVHPAEIDEFQSGLLACAQGGDQFRLIYGFAKRG